MAAFRRKRGKRDKGRGRIAPRGNIMSCRGIFCRSGALAAAFLSLAAGAALANTDEIQVYTGEIMAPGEVGLTWHNNYTFDGTKTADFPKGFPDNHTYNSVTEWAFGVTDWFEAGLYLPLYSHSESQGFTFNGFKLRALFVQPHNEEKDFYYGVNFEFSWNQPVWDTQVNTGEIRPIIGWRFDKDWSFTINPIVDNSYKGGIGALEFVPSVRLDYALNEKWTVALEEYADFGQLKKFLPSREQNHALWTVADYTGDPVSVEFGAGFGLTPASDAFAVKLMLISDLTGPHRLFK
jgi:hypothetical protein